MKLKIVPTYILGLLLILGFWLIDRIDGVQELLATIFKDSSGRSFGVLLMYGIIKYGMLVVGIMILILLTRELIRKNAT